MARALISVSDKTGVVEFAKELEALGWEILSTSGTMKMLREAGVKVTSVSDATGFPEICDGRVKTLHPAIHGGLLARRDDPSHMDQIARNGIQPIDLVCVNLYPFAATIAKPDVTMEDAIEHIDIGGPSMVRSAAKNWESVTIVVNPEDYAQVLDELKAEGHTSRETRLQLSAKAYTHTAEYDIMIASWMREKAGLNEKLFLEYDFKQGLRYGENPHQEARFYASTKAYPYSLATAEQLHGKELSYNNIQDANAALDILKEFDEPFCVGLKHMNPCGAATGKTIKEAWEKAYSADKVSIFGGIVAINRELDKETAELMKPIFLEIIMAPSFSEGALEVLTTKKNLRLLKIDMSNKNIEPMKCVSVNGGLLRQEADTRTRELSADLAVTDAKPTDEMLKDLEFAWKLVKHVKSNAILVAKDGRTLGVGAGQMNRVGSAAIALKQASETLAAEGKDIKDCKLVMSSDAFFPFGDSVTTAAEYGIAAIVQPGGSVRDQESIDAANKNNIPMLFTGERHFKH